MNWGLVGIVGAYLVLAVLLVNLIVDTPWALSTKAALVLGVVALYYLTYQSLPPLRGWPTSQQLPRRFNLVGVRVQEPDKIANTLGGIYLWVMDMEQAFGPHVPRAYALPFTPELHAKVTEAAGKLRKNISQLGEQGDNSKAEARQAAQGQQVPRLQFYDMPDPLFRQSDR
jgi:hypothetical protein